MGRGHASLLASLDTCHSAPLSKKHRASANIFPSETMCMHLDKNGQSFAHTPAIAEQISQDHHSPIMATVPAAPSRAISGQPRSAAADLGFDRVVALRHRRSTSYQIY